MYLSEEMTKKLMLEGFRLAEEESFEDFSMFTENADLLLESLDSRLIVALNEDENENSEAAEGKAKSWVDSVKNLIPKSNAGKAAAIAVAGLAVLSTVVGVAMKTGKGAELPVLKQVISVITKAAEKAQSTKVYQSVAKAFKTAGEKLGNSKLAGWLKSTAAKFSMKKEAVVETAIVTESLDELDFELDMLLAESEMDLELSEEEEVEVDELDLELDALDTDEDEEESLEEEEEFKWDF